MISPLPNNKIGPGLEPLPEVDQNNRDINVQQTNVIYFGPIYQDLLQTEHFEREYQYLILQSIPPLIRFQPPIPSRVGVIPSSIKRSPLIPATHETTTLTHILEPTTHKSENNISVFSGPHFLPEKYSIKPVATFRQSYFVPTYKDDTPSRYFATPHIQQYFQAALQDGSYFEAYSDYRTDDPVNFRHAYNSTQPSNSLDSHEQVKSTSVSHSESTKPNFTSESNRYTQLNQILNRPSQRLLHRPAYYKPVLLTRPEPSRPLPVRPEPYRPETSYSISNRYEPSSSGFNRSETPFSTHNRSEPSSSTSNRYDQLSSTSNHPEPSYSTPNRSEPYRAESSYPTPNRSEPSYSTSNRHESSYSPHNYNKHTPYDSSRSDPPHPDPPCSDPPRSDPSHSDSPRPELPRLEQLHLDPPHSDPPNIDSPRIEPFLFEQSSFDYPETSESISFEEPVLASKRKWHKPLSVSSESTSEEDSDSSMIMANVKGKGKESRETGSDESTAKRKAAVYSPHPDIKKRKVFAKIPPKTEAIEELRQLGKFIKAWTQKDAEVCCVCFEDVTTEHNPLVYCDNALCEVIVHKNCYKIKSNIANIEHWYCDRCRPVNGVSVYRNVACVLCPNITGAFCKLSNPFHGVEWVHMICGNNFTGPGGFSYQAKTHDYRLLIRHHIPMQRFLGACMYCNDPMFAEFGAKLKCRYCPQLFHVTCASKNGYWCFNKDAILACAEHAITTTTKSSPKRLALAFEKWISKRDSYILDQFNISHISVQIDTWKRIASKVNLITENDVMDESFKIFFDRINIIPETVAEKRYTEYVDYLLNEFCRCYSSSYMLSIHGLFLKKNFYHSAVYGYVPPKNGYNVCRDKDSTKKKVEKSSREATPRLTLYTNANSTSNIGGKKSSTSTTSEIKSTASTTTSTATTPTPKTKRTDEDPIVVPSPDLICYICGQHEFPKVTWDSFNFEEGYVEHLKATSHQRKLGHTGTGNFWDPRVFIQCAECHLKVHCGCPNPPIKKYPQKFQSFVCIHCDTKEEEVSLKSDFHRRRGTTGINYKV